MIVLNARNVNDALPKGLALIQKYGEREESRNGPVLRVPEPVATVYSHPCERVLFAPWRDANPTFHVIEALWMIAGRNDLKQLTPYVARMADFSDDGGKTQPAAYGKRWRAHEVRDDSWPDQLTWAAQRLLANPGDRRVVVQMWDPYIDIWAADHGGKDVPCNLTMLPYVARGTLNMTVLCRSNDLLLGLFGANAVHLTFAHEYLARRVDLPVGEFTTVSNNLHLYESDLKKVYTAEQSEDPYVAGRVCNYSIFDDWDLGFPNSAEIDRQREIIIAQDLKIFFEHSAREAATKARWPFLRRVAAPMALAHEHWRNTKGEDRYLGALEILQQVQASDWRRAAEEWIRRRHQRWLVAADGGAHE